MPNRVQTTEHQTFCGRLGGALCGALFGIVLTFGSLYLVHYNEGWAVRTSRSLDEAAAMCIDAPANEFTPDLVGKVVYLHAPVASPPPVRDAAFGVTVGGAFDLQREVEMYQWVEHEHKKTVKTSGGGSRTTRSYTYSKEWRSSREASEHFHDSNGHYNPPFPPESSDRFASSQEVRAGVYDVAPALSRQLGRSDTVDLTAAGVLEGGVESSSNQIPSPEEWSAGATGMFATANSIEKNREGAIGQTSLDGFFDSIFRSTLFIGSSSPSTHPTREKPSLNPPNNPTTFKPTAIAARNMALSPDGTYLVKGNWNTPQVGDVRVKWVARRSPSTASFVGVVGADQSISAYSAAAGDSVALAADGHMTRSGLFVREHQRTAVRTWVLRGVGWLLCFIAINLILQPIVVAPDIIPFLGPFISSMVGLATCTAALTVSIALSVAVAAVSWIFYRPIVGISLAAIALGFFYLSKRGRNQRQD